MKRTTWIFIAILAYLTRAAQDKVIICSGRIQFDKANVDVQNIKVESTSITGVKKYEVILNDDASYSIPVDSVKQSIILRPVSSGFLFQPKQYKLTKSELEECDQHSFDFKLAGFQVQSKVVSAESSKPVSGVKVTLLDSETSAELQSSESDSEGLFGFDKVKPGKYLIQAQAQGISWKENKLQCHVAGPAGSKECSDTVFYAVGYEVKGSVFAEGKGLKDLTLTIKPKQVQNQVRKNADAFCKVQKCEIVTDSKGSFVVEKLPEGDYTIIPQKGALNMQFKPKELAFTISTEIKELSSPFQLQSYDIKGSLETKLQNPYTVVLLQGNQRSEIKVGKDGKFLIKEAKLGVKYSVETECEDYEFEPTPLLVQHPDTSKSVVLKAAKFSLCGEVIQATKSERKLEMKSKSGSTSITTAKDGKFCVKLAPGEYTITPALTNQESKEGYIISPRSKVVKIADKPIKGIKFEQKKIILRGKVEGLSAEEQKKIEIALLNSASKEVAKIKVQSGKFEFKEVTTGSYRVEIKGEEYCFKKNQLEIKISGEEAINELIQAFLKTGYSLRYESTHLIENAVLKQEKEKVQTLTFQAGKNKVCIPNPGSYVIDMPRCYQFQEKQLTYATNKQELLKINPVRFGVEGSIVIENTKQNIPLEKIVNIKINNQKFLQLTKTKQKNQWSYFYMADPKEVLKIKISQKQNLSNDLLFIYRQFLIEPDSLEMSVNSNCHKKLDFVIKMGRIVKGEVSPKIAGVEISMYDEDTEKVLQSTMTDQKGRYELAPMDASIEFELDAKKEGYQLIEIKESKEDENRRDFVLKKLSSLVVSIKEKDTKKPVSKVIHILSNTAPNSAVEIEPGKYMFTNIKQGKQRLQVMLREYEFEDKGMKTIQIEEGKQHEVTILATRVSFSAYGRVTELSTKPVKNVLVVAKCTNEVCEDGVHEGVTNSEGEFRIEELKPKGVYEIRVAKGKLSESEQDYGQKLESKIHATIPKKIEIEMENEDQTDLEFMVKLFTPFVEVQGRIFLEDEDITDFRQILKQPGISIEVYEVGEEEKTKIDEIDLTISRIFKISGLHRNKTYELKIKPDTRQYKRGKYTIVANEETERKFLKIQIKKAPKQMNEFEEESEGSPIAGLGILAALVGGFVYFKKKN